MPRPPHVRPPHVLLMVALLLVVACGGTGEGTPTTGPTTAPTPGPTTAAMGPTSATIPAPGAPNVVVIMTDDQRLDSLAVMPHTLELIGTTGVTFTQALASYPLCCPSRATFLTGQYAHNHGVQDNVPPSGGIGRLDHDQTLPVWLRAAGYTTSFVGKYLNGYALREPPRAYPGWDAWFAVFDADSEHELTENLAYFGYSAFVDGEVRTFGDTDTDYQTDVLRDRAVEEVTRLSSGDQPFFLYVAVGAPHSGTGRGAPSALAPAPAPRHDGLFADTPLPEVPSMLDEDISDKPDWVHEYEDRANQVIAERGLPPIATMMTELWQAHLESLLAVDELVEALVEALESSGTLEDTVVIFTSDNGLMVGEHRLYDAKVAPYEEAIRIPLLVTGPGFPAGTQVETPVPNVDLAATIVALAGAQPTLTMDGKSLLEVVADPSTGTDRAVLLEGPVTTTFIDPYVGVRLERFTYVRYPQTDPGPSAELYDLSSDPYQLDNLIDDPDYAATVDALDTLTDQLQACAGPSCAMSVPIGG